MTTEQEYVPTVAGILAATAQLTVAQERQIGKATAGLDAICSDLGLDGDASKPDERGTTRILRREVMLLSPERSLVTGELRYYALETVLCAVDSELSSDWRVWCQPDITYRRAIWDTQMRSDGPLDRADLKSALDAFDRARKARDAWKRRVFQALKLDGAFDDWQFANAISEFFTVSRVIEVELPTDAANSTRRDRGEEDTTCTQL